MDKYCSFVYILNLEDGLALEEFSELFHRTNRKEKVLSFHHKMDQDMALAGDILTRKVVTKHLGILQEYVIIDYNKYGKPFVKNRPDFYYNISHKGNTIVLATSNRCIGIDIEPIQMPNEMVINYCYTKEEKERIHGAVSAAYEYTQLWTLKESYVKNIGVGMNYPLKKVCFIFDKELRMYKLLGLDNYSFLTLNFDNYLVSLCICENYNVQCKVSLIRMSKELLMM